VVRGAGEVGVVAAPDAFAASEARPLAGGEVPRERPVEGPQAGPGGTGAVAVESGDVAVPVRPILDVRLGDLEAGPAPPLGGHLGQPSPHRSVADAQVLGDGVDVSGGQRASVRKPIRAATAARRASGSGCPRVSGWSMGGPPWSGPAAALAPASRCIDRHHVTRWPKVVPFLWLFTCSAARRAAGGHGTARRRRRRVEEMSYRPIASTEP
jgi:hypothetical protein